MRSITSGLALVPPAAISCRVITRSGCSEASHAGDPTAERLAGQVGALDARGVEVGEEVGDVVGDLVGMVEASGVAVAEHVDGVAPEAGFDVGDDVAGERLEVAARAVQEHHVGTVTGAQGARRDAAGVDVVHAVGDGGEIGPRGHGKSPDLSMTATAMPVSHSGIGE